MENVIRSYCKNVKNPIEVFVFPQNSVPLSYCPFPSLPFPSFPFLSLSGQTLHFFLYSCFYFSILRNSFPFPSVSLTYISTITLLSKQKFIEDSLLQKEETKIESTIYSN